MKIQPLATLLPPEIVKLPLGDLVWIAASTAHDHMTRLAAIDEINRRERNYLLGVPAELR